MTDATTLPQISTRVTIPPGWVVIIHNDDHTPVDFVIGLIMEVFHKEFDDALAITQEIHEKGQSSIGTYSKEVAETKAMMIKQAAAKESHPLMATFQREG